MERLTYNEVLANQYYPNENIDNEEVFNKLGKLEDIEQELGIPLEVLFKAFKDGIYYINNLNEIEFMYNPKLFYAEHLNYYRFREGTFLIEDIVNLKDYGKTWWLEEPKEELENAED